MATLLRPDTLVTPRRGALQAALPLAVPGRPRLTSAKLRDEEASALRSMLVSCGGCRLMQRVLVAEPCGPRYLG